MRASSRNYLKGNFELVAAVVKCKREVDGMGVLWVFGSLMLCFQCHVETEMFDDVRSSKSIYIS